MTYLKIAFFLLYTIGLSAQGIVLQSKNKDGIAALTQDKIDSLETVADGYMVLNLSSGCLNYYFSNKWFEICGNCIPKPQIVKIDTIIQINNLLKIYFQQVKDVIVSFKTTATEKWVVAEDSTALVQIPSNSTTVAVQMKATNACGSIDTMLSVKVKTLVIGPVEYIKINGKDMATRKIGTTRWMCEDYVPPAAKTLKEQPSFFTMTDDSKTCPNGWSVPSQTDWEQLLSSFTENNSQLFLKPEDKNSSIGLGDSGLYAIEEQKFYAPQSAYYWTKGKAGDKQNLLSITKNGYAFLSEKAEKAAMPLRCVSY